MITFEEIKKNQEIKTYISAADRSLSALGFTEHSFAHVGLVSDRAARILESLGVEDRTVELAKIAESCGVAAVAVHGRTREQYYSGQADWNIIRQVKEAVSIPVIGNGDVTSPERAKELLATTGCDGVMIGRGAQGNPWIFRDTVSYLETGLVPAPPTNQEKKQVILEHADLQVKYKGEYTAVREMRKHLSWYTVGMPNSARFRQMINSMESMEGLLAGVETIFG